MLTDLTLLLTSLALIGAGGVALYVLYALTQLPRYFRGER